MSKLKKNLILPLAALLLFATQGMAQVKFGPKVGIGATVTEVQAAVDAEGNIGDKFEQANLSTYGGLFLRLQLGGIYLQPEATISTLKDLDIPLMVGLKLGPASIHGGPYMRMAFDRNALTPEDRKTMLQDARFGYQAGLGVDIGKKLSLDIRYEGNLSTFGNSVQVFGQNRIIDTGDPQILLSLGYSF